MVEMHESAISVIEQQRNPTSLGELVGSLRETNMQTIGSNDRSFCYVDLPREEQEQFEAILSRIVRGRTYDPATNAFANPPEESRETVYDHAIDLLQAGHEIQELSLDRKAAKQSNPNYFGLGSQIIWSVYATNAVFHDIGEGSEKGDLPRSVETHVGHKKYLEMRQEWAAAEREFFTNTVLPMIHDDDQRGFVLAMYESYEARALRKGDPSLQLLHIVDKIRAAVITTQNGTAEAKSARQGGIDSALGSVKELLPFLSADSAAELAIYLYRQLSQITDMPQALNQLRDALAEGLEPPTYLDGTDKSFGAKVIDIGLRREQVVSIQEIERKYRMLQGVNTEILDKHCPKADIWQGYVAINSDGSEVRVRQKGDEYYKTLKSGHGSAREETDEKISAEEFFELLPQVRKRIVQKTRYQVPVTYTALIMQGDNTEPLETLTVIADVDVYKGGLEELAVAEFEFPDQTVHDLFFANQPEWMDSQKGFVEDVTDDDRYKNQNLALYGNPALAA